MARAWRSLRNVVHDGRTDEARAAAEAAWYHNTACNLLKRIQRLRLQQLAVAWQRWARVAQSSRSAERQAERTIQRRRSSQQAALRRMEQAAQRFQRRARLKWWARWCHATRAIIVASASQERAVNRMGWIAQRWRQRVMARWWGQWWRRTSVEGPARLLRRRRATDLWTARCGGT